MSIELDSLVSCADCKSAIVKKLGKTVDIYCDSGSEQARKLFMTAGVKSASKCNQFKHLSKVEGAEIKLDEALRYMLAGNSEFTLVSGRTGARLRYKLKKRKSQEPGAKEGDFIYFIHTLLPHNGKMGYAGFLKLVDDTFSFVQGKKGAMPRHSVEIKSLLYVLNNLYAGDDTLNLRVFHSGRCGKCGRKLTSPESVLTGIGPECAKMVGITRKELK